MYLGYDVELVFKRMDLGIPQRNRIC